MTHQESEELSLWGRLITFGGLLTRLLGSSDTRTGPIANRPQDTILPHFGRGLRVAIPLIFAMVAVAAEKPPKKEQPKQISALDKYIQEASQPATANSQIPANGSLWSPSARFSDLASDLRARRVDDIVTIVVQESASAASTGATKTSRAATAQSNIAALAGLTKAAGPLANLANLGGSQSLNGEGATSRQTSLTTIVSARVTHVLANGNLVVEGTKNVNINSENQVITIRGVIRSIDLDTTNSIQSARLAQMEVQVNGKGVVNDAVRRPNILYRLLLGLLPF